MMKIQNRIFKGEQFCYIVNGSMGKYHVLKPLNSDIVIDLIEIIYPENDFNFWIYAGTTINVAPGDDGYILNLNRMSDNDPNLSNYVYGYSTDCAGGGLLYKAHVSSQAPYNNSYIDSDILIPQNSNITLYFPDMIDNLMIYFHEV